MCYSAQQKLPISKLEEAMNAIAKLPEYLDDDDLEQYHINGFAKHYLKGGTKMAPHPIMLVQPQENPKFLAPIMWGLIPKWESGDRAEEYYKETLPYGSGLNAKSEKLFSSRMYMDSALSRRCVVPVTGFFEPHTTPAKVKGRPFKVPFMFERRDRDVIKLAGIYEFASNGEATFSILTKPATPLFEKIHNTKKRRPVILHDEQTGAWLDNSASRGDLEEIISTDMPDELLYAHPISRDLYSPKAESNRENISETVHYKEIEIDYEDKPEPQDLFS